MFKENLSVKGSVNISLHDGLTHEVKHSEQVNNLVTSIGKNFIARKILTDSEVVSSISIGSGNTQATVNDTQIETPLASADIRFSFVDNAETNVVHFVSTFEENVGTGTVREVGLFSNAPSQNLLCRTVVTTPFNKTSTDYLVVSWKLQIG